MARDITRELIEVLTRDLKVDASEVGPETPLFEGGLDLDSFAVVEMVTKIETHFGIQVSDADFMPENFTNVKTLSSVIEKYLPAEAG